MNSGDIAAFPARRPRLTLGIALLCAILAIFSIRRFHTDASMQSMFPADDPASAAMALVLGHFRAADDLLVLVSLKEGQPTDAEQPVQFADRLKAAIGQSPADALVEAVVYRIDDDSKRFFERVLVPAGIYYLDDSSFAAARKRLTAPEMAKQIQRNEAMIAAPGPAASALSSTLLKDPLRLHEFILDQLANRMPMKTAGGSGAFLSADGRSLLIRIVGTKSLDDLDYDKKLTTAITSLCHEVNKNDLQIDISGGYAIATASERAIRRDMIISVGTSIFFLQALFIFAYRRPIRYFLLAFIPVALGILIGFGLRALLPTAISPAVAVVGAILGGLGIDYTVLYLPPYLVARVAGEDSIAATSHTTTRLAPTLLAACVTSIVGFVAIGWSSVPAIRDFAVVGSLGLAGALAASMIVLPAMLAIVRRRGGMEGPRINLSPLLEWIAVRRRGSIAITLIILIGLSLFIILGPGKLFPLETDLTVMHPRPNAALNAQNLIAERMGIDPSSMLIYIEADSPNELTLRSSAVAARLSTRDAKRVGVRGAFGLSSLLPDPAVVARRRDAISASEVDQIVTDFHAAIRASSFSELAYQPYEKFLRQILLHPTAPTIQDLLPFRRLAEMVLSREELARQVHTKWQSITAVFFDRSLDDLTTRGKAISTIRRLLGEVPGATLTGMSVIGYDTQAVIARDLPKLMGIAVALVAVYLLIHFRNFGKAGLAMLPAIFSIVVRLAFMRVSGEKFNLINLISLPLLVGIDVDYGVFIVSLASRKFGDVKNGVPRGISSASHSVMVSALANFLGFGSLITTSVPAIRSLGWAVGIGIIACTIATFFLLIPLLAGRKESA